MTKSERALIRAALRFADHRFTGVTITASNPAGSDSLDEYIALTGALCRAARLYRASSRHPVQTLPAPSEEKERAYNDGSKHHPECGCGICEGQHS